MKYLNLVAVALLMLFMVSVPGKAQAQYQNGYYGQQQNWRANMSPSDQQEFDKDYAKWVDAQQKNDRDDIDQNSRRMQDIMARYNIPANVPFGQIASNSGAYPAYPAQGAYPVYNGPRLSADDQRKYDEEYGKWLDSQRKNDQDDVAKHAGKMQEIMTRNNIANVPYAAIATNGYAAAPVAAAPYGYAYPQGAAQRLSSKDQHDFDNDFRHWVDARRKRDMDDVDKNARKMQEIMARYNIPANVPFEQVATPGSEVK